jgi:hypothetical protein
MDSDRPDPRRLALRVAYGAVRPTRTDDGLRVDLQTGGARTAQRLGLAGGELITRRAFGFHSPHAAIALAMLALGGLCPSLPGR